MALRHGVYDSDTHFIINPITRTIRSDGSSKTTLIQNDHNSERFTFEIPRYIEGHDMSLCNVVQVHYDNIDSQTKAQSKGLYEVDDKQISPENGNMLVCSWLISQNATQYVGSLNFLVRFSCVEEDGTISYAWNTAVYSNISISNGIYNGDIVIEEYTDVLEQWRKDLFDISDHFARAVVEGDTLTIENVTEPTQNELAKALEDGSFAVAKAEEAIRAEEAGIADMALQDNAGNSINEAYMRWEDFQELEHPLGDISTTKSIVTGWDGKTDIGELPQNRTLDKITTVVIGVTFDIVGSNRKVIYFTGLKIKPAISDSNGEFVEFYCQPQSDVNSYYIGTMCVRVYQTNDNDLKLVIMHGWYSAIYIANTDEYTNHLICEGTYDIAVNHYLTSVKYWFA